MPDATGYADVTIDVTAGNQDVPEDMNQPAPYGGQNPFDGSYTPLTPGFIGPHITGIAPDDIPSTETYPGEAPVPPDEAVGHAPHGTGEKRFTTDNAEAVPVFQRSAHDWTSGTKQPSVTSGPIQVVGRQRGRISTTVWVPTKDANGNTPTGVVIGATQGELQQGGFDSVVLNVGDSITIHSEGPVWCYVISGNTGFCQFMTEYNPAGGELGGQ